MGKFVPVVDTEAPRSERMDHGEDAKKHRKFDNMGTTVDRGWEQGKVGWGVQGNFGSSSKDTVAQVLTTGTGQFKMIKNDKGLWVKSVQRDNSTDEVLKPNGRGGGVPVFPIDGLLSHSKASTTGKSDSCIRSRGRRDSPTSDEIRYQRKRSISQDRERCYHGRPRSRSRDDRYRGHSRSRSSERFRRKRATHRDDDESYSRGQSTRRRSPTRGRDADKSCLRRDVQERSRSNERGRDRDGRSSHSRSPDRNHEEVTNSTIDVRFEDAVDDLETPFAFNAVQVVNRFLEIFSTTGMTFKMRLENLEEVFAENVTVSTLKTQKVIMTSRQALTDSFHKAVFHSANPSRRVFISKEAEDVTYCFDLHTPGSSPGLGDPTKDTCLLYRCRNSVITHIWGGADKEHLASLTMLTLDRIQESELWKLVQGILDESSGTETGQLNSLHFQDYTNIEVIR
jgi:hypothetical protein